MKNMSKMPKGGKMPSKAPKTAPPSMAKKPTAEGKRPAESAKKPKPIRNRAI